VQSIPLTNGCWPPLGVTMFWIDQVLPFHTSAQAR
jgi:hypothetical protein